MAELPYTWTDRDGRSLVVDTTGLFTTGPRPGTRFTDAPTGPDAVALARAVLAAAGDTGHMVVDIKASARAIRIHESIAAESMREQAIEAVTQANPMGSIFSPLLDRIRTLPLLPDATREG